MSTMVTRAGKGSPLTNAELDSNFTNLNTDKYQAGGALGTPASGTLTNCTGLPQSGVVNLTTDLALKAPLASPTFTGAPLAPTAAVDTNTTQLATTAFVIAQAYLKSATAASTYAPLASPTFTGAPLAPTAAVDTNTTQLATTAFVVGQGYLKSADAASTYVALTGNQTIAGTKTFSSTITGSISGNAGTVTNGVYTTGDQTIAGVKTFSNQAAFTLGTTIPLGQAARFYNANYGIGTPNLDGLQIFAPSTDTIRFQTMNAGTVTARATLDPSGNFTATANITAYSDERLKENIQMIPDALAKVESVRGVTYTWKESGLAGTGVIAQEIQKVAPEAVLTSDDGTLSVAYGNLVGLLIEAVKDLSSQVKELKAKVG